MEKTINLKLVVLGEGKVGKTSIINTFLGSEMTIRYIPTIGSSTSRKEYEIKTKRTTIKLNIWDIGGQRSFNPLNPAFYANIDIVVLVFDLTRPKETLINIKSDFLEKAKQYSEEPLSLIVGNKLDLFSVDIQFKEAINKYLNRRDYFLLTSAKSGENINELFELLIYTYLKKTELLAPDIVFENTADEFIKSIGKTEKILKSHLVGLSTFDEFLKKLPTRAMPQGKTEEKELKYHEFIQQELQKVEQQKNNIHDQFLINLSELEKALTHIKKSRIKSVDEVIKNLENLLSASKRDFEQSVELIQKLNREENELMVISSKLKNEKLESTNEESNPRNNLYNIN